MRSGAFKATVRDQEQTASLAPVIPANQTTSFVVFLDPEEELSTQGGINRLVARIRKALEDELIDADQMAYTVERVAGRDAAVVTARGEAPAPAWTAESVRTGQLTVERADGTETRAASTGILNSDKENSDYLYLFIALLVLFFIAWGLMAASCCCGMCTDYSYVRTDRTTVVGGERHLASKGDYLDDVSVYSSEYSAGGYREAEVDAEVYTAGVARNHRRSRNLRTAQGRNTEDRRFRDEYEVVPPPMVPGASYATTIGGFPWSAHGGQQQLAPIYGYGQAPPSMGPSSPAYIMPGQQGSQMFYMPVSGAPSSTMMTPLAQEPGSYYYLQSAPQQQVSAPYTPTFAPAPQYVQQGQYQPQNVNQRQVFYTYEESVA